MKIEAKDRVQFDKICVATIADVRPGEVKVYIDGQSNEYDYWCSSSSADIHPCMWSGKQLHVPVTPPPGYEGAFKWNEYLAHPDNRPAPAHVFKKVHPYGVSSCMLFWPHSEMYVEVAIERRCIYSNLLLYSK